MAGLEPELLATLTEEERAMWGHFQVPSQAPQADAFRGLFRSLAEARQDRDDWKATYEAAIVQLKLLADKLEWAEERAGRAEAQVAETRREGCAATGTLENIFNGLTSPNALAHGISMELMARMAEEAANTLATAERCKHKANHAWEVITLHQCMEVLERLLSEEANHHNYTYDPSGELAGCTGCDPKRDAHVLLSGLHQWGAGTGPQE